MGDDHSLTRLRQCGWENGECECRTRKLLVPGNGSCDIQGRARGPSVWLIVVSTEDRGGCLHGFGRLLWAADDQVEPRIAVDVRGDEVSGPRPGLDHHRGAERATRRGGKNHNPSGHR